MPNAVTGGSGVEVINNADGSYDVIIQETGARFRLTLGAAGVTSVALNSGTPATGAVNLGVVTQVDSNGGTGRTGRISLNNGTGITVVDAGGGNFTINATGGATDYDTLIGGMAGLVHRWKFEEPSGNFADSVGSLALAVGGVFTYGVAGGPVSGAAGSVKVGAAGQADSTGLGSVPVGAGPRTIVAVYKGPSAVTADQTLFSYGSSGGTRQWFNTVLNDNPTRFGLYTSADDALWDNTQVLAETWHLAACSYDGNLITTMFLDGAHFGHQLGGVLATAAGGNFLLCHNSGGQQLQDVTWDDLAVFNRALNPWELQALLAAL